jgi:hypothetical protein
VDLEKDRMAHGVSLKEQFNLHFREERAALFRPVMVDFHLRLRADQDAPAIIKIPLTRRP